jgi:predicted glycosyltransferase
MNGPRVFFYVQHLLGIGHLARASRIAAALLAERFDVVLVIGGPPVGNFPPPNIRTFRLPPVKAGPDGFSALVDASGDVIDEVFLAQRRDLLIAALKHEAPDIVVIEAFPFGRRQMRFELLPLLDAIARLTPKPLLVSSIRDILQESHKPGRAEETVDLVKRHFGLVLVHGDRSFAKLEESFPQAGQIADRLSYTGLVAGPPPKPPIEIYDVIVSAGGGAAGSRLALAAAEASRRFAEQGRWLLVTGPNLPTAIAEKLIRDQPRHLSIVPFRPDFASLLAGARLSVSQAGYNTVCDILQARCRSLLVPFAEGGETEQTLRAERLHQRGLASVLPEAGISHEAVAAAVAQALKAPLPPPHELDLEGARNTAVVLRNAL